MFIKQLNPIACKTYLIANPPIFEMALIDPVLSGVGDYFNLISRMQSLDKRWKLTAVIDTHTHADHISAAPALKDVTGCDYYMHQSSGQKCVDKPVEENDVITVAGVELTVLHTPGHTKDSISLVLQNEDQAALFSGDALFLDDGGAGRDDLPGGDPNEHYLSLKKIKSLDEQLIVLPAHDYRERIPSNLARQKVSNPWLKEQSQAEFVAFIEDLKLGEADWMVDVLAANYTCSRDPNAAFVPSESPACEVQGTIGKNIDAIQAESISVLDTQAAIEAKTDLLLLDVRESAELNGPLGQLPGAVNISIGNLQHAIESIEQWKDKPVITICRSGHRAATASKILISLGFKNVKTMDGGMMGWRQQI